MNILYIIAGTGNFYCGTCLRDHALARGLRDAGHDTTVVPLYLPLVTEAPVEGEGPLFFGGINVYLQQISSVFRRTPDWVDAIFDSSALLRIAANSAGFTKPAALGELTVSTLKGQRGRQFKEVGKLIDWIATQAPPDVICLSNALLSGLSAPLSAAFGVPVVCSLQGEDSFINTLPQPYREQAWQLLRQSVADISAYVAVSRYYGAVMQAAVTIPSDKLIVVHNGIDLQGFSDIVHSSYPPVIGYLAQMIPGKGLETLVDAFIRMHMQRPKSGLRLRIAGSLTPADRSFVDGLDRKLVEAECRDCVDFLPNINRDQKLEFLRSISVLSVPAVYGEAFGLYILEALAAGVPVVQPRHAAFPELIESTGGGVMYDAEGPDGLADALAALIADPERVRMLGERGRNVVMAQFGQDHMTKRFLTVLESVTATNEQNRRQDHG